MPRVPIYKIQLVRDGSVSFSQPVCATPSLAVDLFRAYVGDPDREHMVAIFLDSQNRFIGLHTIAVGTVDYCVFTPREVYKAALLCNATSLVLAHNHPSGDSAPSTVDIEITRELQRAGELLDVALMDHVVVGQPGYSSFMELGLLNSAVVVGPPPKKRKSQRSAST